MRELLLIVALLFGPLNLWAGEAPPAAADPVLEQKLLTIANELRCLVCQNQTIADSDAPLAVDLREQIREQLKQGKSPAEIMGYMVERYGDFVLYRPPVKATTILLWTGPLLLMLIGLVVMYRKITRRRADPARLSEADHQAAARLLSGGEAER